MALAPPRSMEACAPLKGRRIVTRVAASALPLISSERGAMTARHLIMQLRAICDEAPPLIVFAAADLLQKNGATCVRQLKGLRWADFVGSDTAEKEVRAVVESALSTAEGQGYPLSSLPRRAPSCAGPRTRAVGGKRRAAQAEYGRGKGAPAHFCSDGAGRMRRRSGGSPQPQRPSPRPRARGRGHGGPARPLRAHLRIAARH